MTDYDFDKIFAKVEDDMGAERSARIDAALTEAVNEAITKARQSTSQIVTEMIEQRKAELSEFEEQRAQSQTDHEKLRAALVAAHLQIEDAASAAVDRLRDLETDKANVLEARLNKLNSAERFERLFWSDLPVKIAAALALIIGIIVGAGATVFLAASRKADLDLQQALATQSVQELQAFVDHWETTTGFRLDTRRGQPVFILNEGQKFVRYVPPMNALDAGNLWRIDG